MNVKKIVSAIACLFLISCSINYIPIETAEVIVSENFGIINETDFTMAVSYKYWDKDPQEISDYFTAFYISFKNNSSSAIELNRSDFYLITDNDLQYDAVELDEIIDLIMPEDIYFQQFTTQELQEDNLLEEWKDARSNIMKYGFNFGKILPNTRKEGYLFFNKIPLDNQQCKIIYNSSTIIFSKED